MSLVSRRPAFFAAVISLLPMFILATGDLACSKSAVPSDAVAAPAVGKPAGGGVLSTADLYGACKERVEGGQTPGECTVDSGCAKAGCSHEVCVPVHAVPEIQTTCEKLPCFATLDTCGCHEGECTWTLKDAAIPLAPLPAPAGATTIGTPTPAAASAPAAAPVAPPSAPPAGTGAAPK